MANESNNKVFEFLNSKDKLDLFGYNTAIQESTLPKTNKPMGTKDVHNTLLAAGFTPGLGNIADAADAILYALEGEFGEAGWSMASALPVIGQFVSSKRALKAAKDSGEEMVTLWRGVNQWEKGKMVKEGSFVSPKKLGGSGETLNPSKKGIFATKNKKYAEEHLQYEDPGAAMLEFQIPKSVYNKLDIDAMDWVEGGISKTYLKKVHYPTYDEWGSAWKYAGEDVIDAIKF